MIKDIKSEPYILILFGATGDLTMRKIIPALYNLFLDNWLPEQFIIIGSSSRKIDEATFRKDLMATTSKFSRNGKVDKAKWDTFASSIFHQAADFKDGDSFKPFHEDECLDVFTHYGAIEELKTNKPRVLYIAYVETDEWAHSGHYKDYLDAANMVDKWIADIWNYVQRDPYYKGKTAIFITTDHGRGDAVKTEWTSHNNKIKDAYQIWMAAMGPGIKAKGEVKTTEQFYQKQFAQTMAALLGLTFKASHPIADKIDLNK